jgi:HAD superfamily hydrolase (TIGR01549 family)
MSIKTPSSPPSRIGGRGEVFCHPSEEVVQELKPNTDISLDIYKNQIQAKIDSVQLYPETISVLKTLKNNGLKLGLISNSAFNYKIPFYKLGLDKYFDIVIFSFEVGLQKPDPEIYKLLLDNLKIKPDEAIMVGDKFLEDVQAPQELGIKGILCSRDKNIKDSIHTLEDIFSQL